MTRSLDLAFAALADPTRRELLKRIAHRPQPVVELCAGFPISQPAISKHLRVLREAGLIDLKKRGREHVYHLASDGFTDMHAYLESVRAMWADTLQAFADYVENRE
jgi:DNA-binding transcriptional ArsR family regulator